MFLYTYSYFQERVSLIVPWIVGLITFMALEAVAIVYSNVLRDHVNKVSCKCRTIHIIYHIHVSHIIIMSEAVSYGITRVPWRTRIIYIIRINLQTLNFFYFQKFDSFCKIEVTFYLIRAVLNVSI